MFPGWSSCNRHSHDKGRGNSFFSLNTKELHRLPNAFLLISSSLFLPPNTQHGLLKRIFFFLRTDCFISQIPLMYGNSPSMTCHNSTSSLQKHQDKKAQNKKSLVQFLNSLCTAALLLPLWHIYGIPTFGAAVRMDSLTLVQTSGRAALEFVLEQHFGPLRIWTSMR